MSAPTRPSCYLLPSAELALHFASRRRHQRIKFLPGGKVACLDCKQVMDAVSYFETTCEGKPDGAA